MATQFRYRAVLADGNIGAGVVEASDLEAAIQSLRSSGNRPIEVAADTVSGIPKGPRLSGKTRQASIQLIGELAVLLRAGLPLDRALALGIANIEDPVSSALFADILMEVREGAPLSRAMADRPHLFSPVAAAMAEAGESNGQLGEAMARLSAMLESADELRKLVATSMIYPIALAIVAVGVILLMLLFVVPQFESLFTSAKDTLPASSRFVMGASKMLRDYGLLIGLAVLVFGFAVRQSFRTATGTRLADRLVLRMPQFGDLVRSIETARFARTLGALVEGDVSLPVAISLARRTVGNSQMGDAIDHVATGVREGEGMAAPLAAARILPTMAIGFIRTGEETSQLGPMLARLADILDRDVKVRLQRLIGVLTPAVTVFLGASVAGIIASIMTAIMGFNDVALSQ